MNTSEQAAAPRQGGSSFLGRLPLDSIYAAYSQGKGMLPFPDLVTSTEARARTFLESYKDQLSSVDMYAGAKLDQLEQTTQSLKANVVARVTSVLDSADKTVDSMLPSSATETAALEEPTKEAAGPAEPLGAEARKALRKVAAISGKVRARVSEKALASLQHARLRSSASVEALRTNVVDLMAYARRMDTEPAAEAEAPSQTSTSTTSTTAAEPGTVARLTALPRQSLDFVRNHAEDYTAHALELAWNVAQAAHQRALDLSGSVYASASSTAASTASSLSAALPDRHTLHAHLDALIALSAPVADRLKPVTDRLKPVTDRVSPYAEQAWVRFCTLTGLATPDQTAKVGLRQSAASRAPPLTPVAAPDASPQHHTTLPGDPSYAEAAAATTAETETETEMETETAEAPASPTKSASAHSTPSGSPMRFDRV